MSDELRAASADAWRAVERMRGLVPGDGGILGVLGERIAALLGEFAWEAGLIDPSLSTPGARLDHVGIVVGDLRAAAALYGDLLGGVLVSGGRHAGMGVKTLHFTYAGSKVELLSPERPGPVADFLEARGGGLHHLTFFVDDLTSTMDGATAGGLKVVDVNRDAPEWQEAYLGPRSTQGCVIQLAQSADLAPVPGVTVESVLAGEWEWVDHRARRVSLERR
jgi:methylmalonyl-CoA/ethylmalonyl-CoA epimerase